MTSGGPPRDTEREAPVGPEGEATSPLATRPGAKLAAVAGVAVLLLLAQRNGLFALAAEPSQLRQAVLELGPWGYLAFVVAYACLQPFGVPGTAFILAASLTWPWPTAFGVSMVGTMAASVVGFSFARFVARDWVSRRVPARFRSYDDALARRGFATVVTLRFIFWMPPMLHAFFGVSRVGFWTHFWGSAVGYVVPLLLTAYFGQQLFDAMRDAPTSVWVAMGLAMVAIAAGVWFTRRRRAGRREATPDAAA